MANRRKVMDRGLSKFCGMGNENINRKAEKSEQMYWE